MKYRTIHAWSYTFLHESLEATAIQSCIKFKKFKRSSIELTFNSSSKFLSFLSFMKEREGNFELELKVSSFELLSELFELDTALLYIMLSEFK